jgi:hypothetical protein
MTSGVVGSTLKRGKGVGMTSEVTPPKESPAEDNSQADDNPKIEEISGSPAGERRRGRHGRVAVSLIIAAALLVLGFSPVSRLVALGLPRAPGSFAPVVLGSQHGNTTAVQVVPAGLPAGARIRTAGDVQPPGRRISS